MKWTLAFGLLSISILCAGQKKQAAWWFFGDSLGLNFNTSPPTPIETEGFKGVSGAAAIADSIGSLLFYADALRAFNRSGSEMLNGRYLSDSIYNLFGEGTYPSLILPVPNKPSQYYLIISGYLEKPFPYPFPWHVYYSIVDMSLDNGLGGIVEDKKRIPIADTANGMIGSAPHANGKDNWFYQSNGLFNKSNRLRRYLVSESGINEVFPHINLPKAQRFAGGEMKSSPDGKKFGIIYQTDSIFVFDINNETGELFNPIGLRIPNNASCAFSFSFSPNSKLLYTTNCSALDIDNPNNKIYQFNLEAGSASNVQNSGIEVGSFFASRSATSSMQLAIDGKIYSGFRSDSLINTINCPDVIGVGCNFQRGAIVLPRKMGPGFFPVQNQAFFINVGKLQISTSRDTICSGDSVYLNAYGASASSFQWRTRPQGPVISGNADLKIKLNTTTTFYVRGQSNCSSPKDTSITIYVRPAPIASIARPGLPRADTLRLCQGDSLLLFSGQAPQAGMLSTWYNGQTGPFLTLATASLNLGLFRVYVTTSNRYCSRSDTVWVRVLPRPAPPQISLSPAADTLGFCPGQTVQLNASPGFSAYAWSNGSTGSQTSFSVPLLPGYTGGLYPFAVQGVASGCQSPASDTLWLRFRPSPLVPTIQTNPAPGPDGLAKVCPGDSIALAGVNPYAPQLVRWRWSSGDTLQNIHVQPIGLSALRLQLLYPAVNGCLSPADTVQVGNHPVPVVSGFEGPLSVCPGVQQVPYQAVGTFLDSVFWQAGIGVVSASGWQSAGTTVLVNFPVLQTDSAWLQVLPQSVHGCLGDTFRAYVRINTRLRPALPLGDSLVCTFNLNKSYRGYLSPGSAYQWTVAGGQIMGNPNELQVQVQWPGPGLGFVRYRETVTIGDSVCEGESPPLQVAIARSPDSTLQIAGPAALCMRSEGVFSLPGFLGSSYRWALPGSNLPLTADSAIRARYPQAGLFNVTVVETSDSGCVGRPITSEVRVNPLPLPMPGPNRELCSGESVLLGTANAPMLRYRWQPAVFLNDDILQNPVFRMAYFGQQDTLLRYTLRVTDFVSACSDTASVNIRVKPQPPSPARSDTALCEGGRITLGQNQTGPYLYQWAPVAGLDFPQDPNPVFSLPNLTVERDSLLQKTVLVRHLLSGCTTSDTVNIGLWAFPKVAFAQVPEAFCAGAVATVSLNPPRPDLNLLWKLEPGNVVQTGQNFSYRFENLDTSSKSFQLNLQASSTNGCQTNMAPLELRVNPYPVPNLSGLDPYLCPEQESGYVYALPGPSKYLFEAQNGQVTQTSDTSATVTWPLNPASWQLIVSETRPDGCTSLPKTLNLQLDNQLQHCDLNNYLPFLPNVVTPNADGKNDNWHIDNIQYYPQNSLSVFDRWGKKVFTASPYQNNWGANAKPGTFFYHFNDGRTGKAWKGWVEVLGEK